MYGEVITIGILVSLVFAQLVGISPAGLIAAGYLALNVGSPLKLCLTLGVSLITLGLYRILTRFMILYGKRRFAVMLLISLAVGRLITLLPLPVSGIGVIGYLIPSLIAKECDRQGLWATLGALAAATAVTVLIALLLGAGLL